MLVDLFLLKAFFFPRYISILLRNDIPAGVIKPEPPGTVRSIPGNLLTGSARRFLPAQPHRGFSRVNGWEGGKAAVGVGEPSGCQKTQGARPCLHGLTLPEGVYTVRRVSRTGRANRGAGRGLPPHFGGPRTHRAPPEAAPRPGSLRKRPGLQEAQGWGGAGGGTGWGSRPPPHPGINRGWGRRPPPHPGSTAFASFPCPPPHYTPSPAHLGLIRAAPSSQRL